MINRALLHQLELLAQTARSKKKAFRDPKEILERDAPILPLFPKENKPCEQD